MRRLLRQALRCATTAAFVAACDGAAPAPETPPPIPGEGYANLPPGTDSILLERVARFGSVEGDDTEAFGQIIRILPVPGGGFYTCDRNDMLIRRYDDSGRFLRQVGRRGSGPGEYQYCEDLAVTRDTTLVVSDTPNGRLVFFTPAGDYSRGVQALIGGGLGGGGEGKAFFIDTIDRIWRLGWLPRDDVLEFDRPLHYVRLSLSGERLDSLHVPAPGQSAGRGFGLCTSDGCYSAQPPDSLHATGVTGVRAVASPRAYHIRLTHADGRVVEARREIAATPYGDAERDEWEAWRTFFGKQTPEYPIAAMPKEKPFLRGIRVDELGRTWAHVHIVAEKRDIPPRKAGDLRPLFTWRERNALDLFDPEGRFLGRMIQPVGTQLMASRGDRVWLLEEGESGEQLIGIYDLKPARQ